MSEKMYHIPFRSLMNWVVTEYADCGEIFGMTGRQCQTTIAGGKLLMQDRVLVGIDEEAENAHILEAAKKLWGDLNHRTY